MGGGKRQGDEGKDKEEREKDESLRRGAERKNDTTAGMKREANRRKKREGESKRRETDREVDGQTEAQAADHVS